MGKQGAQKTLQGIGCRGSNFYHWERLYHTWQEELIEELSVLLANRKREVDSLIKLFQSQVVQKDADPQEYEGIKASLNEFTSRLEGLATGVKRSPEKS